MLIWVYWAPRSSKEFPYENRRAAGLLESGARGCSLVSVSRRTRLSARPGLDGPDDLSLGDGGWRRVGPITGAPEPDGTEDVVELGLEQLLDDLADPGAERFPEQIDGGFPAGQGCGRLLHVGVVLGVSPILDVLVFNMGYNISNVSIRGRGACFL